MDISFAFLADSAVALPDGKFYVLGGGFNAFGFPELPAAASFAVVAGFRFKHHDAGRAHQVELRLVDSDGKLVVAPIQMNFQSSGPPPEPDRDIAVQTVTPVTPMFGHPGVYTLEFWSGERVLSTVPFIVNEVNPPALGPMAN